MDQCKPLNLGAYRRYMAHPALLAQVMWPLAVLGPDQLERLPALMQVSCYGEGSHVCVMNESDDEAHVILRGCVAVQLARSDTVTVAKVGTTQQCDSARHVFNRVVDPVAGRPCCGVSRPSYDWSRECFTAM